MSKATPMILSTPLPQVRARGYLPGSASKGTASRHPLSWNRQPINPTGAEGAPMWQMRAVPQPCFPAPFCSTRPMPRFAMWEFPRSAPPHPIESSQHAGASHPNAFPHTGGRGSQVLVRLKPKGPQPQSPSASLHTPQPSLSST